MKIVQQIIDNNTQKRKNTSMAWTTDGSYHSLRMQQALNWEVPGTREDQVDQEQTGEARSRKTCKIWDSSGKR